MELIRSFKRRGRLAVIAVGLTVVGVLGAACTPDGTNGVTFPIGDLSPAQVEALARGVSSFGGGLGTGGTGIQVTGVGTIDVTPDLAIISLGVEGFAPTVAEARDIAADAMAGVLSVLRAAGIDDSDIKTQFFNIQPEYTFDRVIDERGERSERRLVGYRVTNTLSVKVRELDDLGTIIDDSVTAGGDALRLNNISFTLDDGAAFEVEARKQAIQDAVAKADLFASETGETRGKLISIVESSFPRFSTVARAESLAFDGAFAAPQPTQVLAGEMEVRVTVQAVFAIE